ncbi:peptidoglycan/LPS O-acetylase OafA/YrhL [Rhizobium binae]|uniref:Peptidoglycan/LPS O-acetylase OafA/YrhL n=1 Tax=Rhizobium binae TaxID=1138190 RepID=A0ABV2ME05_9HYPH|nr:acyltransferase [Rhizobium binae]MBX4992888.1 acyltransferase [Rhizobium binae]NKL52804.1 acyltransferase family protein [Rhizobium leguminosarum bv. viciae]QSY84171.1 acyltransferase [Rhizobium binae]
MIQRYNLGKETAVIDALRGIAGLLVFLSHADAYNLIRIKPIAHYSGYVGAIGVCVFFVLSGYLIWASAGRLLDRPHGLRTYAIHRAARIMPLYYVALGFAALIFRHVSGYPVEVGFYDMVRHITFTQALIPDVSRALNPVLWTLTFEMIFYVAAPALFALRSFFPAFIIIAASSFILCQFVASPYFKFLNLMPLFVLGMWLAHYRLAPTWVCAVACAVIGIALGLLGAKAYLISSVWGFGVFSAMVWLRGFRSSLAVKALAWVGVISYSLYIWHYMLIEIVGWLLTRVGFMPSNYPVSTGVGLTALTLAVSWASYRYIELPAQASVRRRLSKSFAVHNLSAVTEKS